MNVIEVLIVALSTNYKIYLVCSGIICALVSIVSAVEGKPYSILISTVSVICFAIGLFGFSITSLLLSLFFILVGIGFFRELNRIKNR